MRRTALITAVPLAFIPGIAEAHIKWFCRYDTTVAPLPLSQVVTPAFLAIAAGFAALMFIAYVIDDAVARSSLIARIERAMLDLEPSMHLLIRAAVGAFFVSLWTSGDVILTPELKTANPVIPWLQLVIAVSTLWRPTLALAAVGLLGLYLYGVATYGAFHMMDYPLFLGLAAYLGLSASDRPWLLRFRLPTLYFNLAVTMMWGAIEKFGYPYWTFPLLAAHPDLTLGLRFDLFMTLAGFVEFSIAFFMLTGTALLRLSCLALLMLLASAVPAFGKVDAIGHSLIIVGLIAMTVVGQRGVQVPALLRRGGAIERSSLLTLSYGAAVAVLFAVYYGAQRVAGS